MRFLIDGIEYGTADIGELTQRDMLAMAKQAGMGLQTWARLSSQIERLALADDGETVVVLTPEQATSEPGRVEPDLLFDSERHLRAFLIMVWLARRTSGSPGLTFDESTALPFSALEFLPDVVEDVESGVEPLDPPTASASVPVAVDAAGV
jgi:hypothetical protein